MSCYEKLSAHAAEIQRAAVIAEMKQREYDYDEESGRYESRAVREEGTTEVTISAVQQQFAGVADLFQPFLGLPDPDTLSDLQTALAGVAQKLNGSQAAVEYNGDGVLSNPKIAAIDSIGPQLDNWWGVAARTFSQKILVRWKPVTGNQFSLVIALKGAIAAERALWENARENVDVLAHQAQVALDALGECGQDDVSTMLTVASSVFSVASLVVSENAEIALTLAGEATGLVEGAQPAGEDEEAVFQGRTPAEIIDELQNNLAQLSAQIIKTELVIQDAVANALNVLHENRAMVLAPRPALADATSKSITDQTLGMGTSEG